MAGCRLFYRDGGIFISADDAAIKWGVSSSRVRQLCRGGRIANACVGECRKNVPMWLIPASLGKPDELKRGPKRK